MAKKKKNKNKSPKQSNVIDMCIVKMHFDCNGCGTMCYNCCEAEDACRCENGCPGVDKCEDCDGTGQFCVTHESPCGDLGSPPKCDKAKPK